MTSRSTSPDFMGTFTAVTPFMLMPVLVRSDGRNGARLASTSGASVYGSTKCHERSAAGMLRGATEVFRDEGCALVGGHSGEASEPALGFAVSGLADEGGLTRKSGARPGDRLILTKPLGSGIVLAAHMRGLARAVFFR